MPVFDLFLYRKRRAEGERPDVFVYDTLPQPLRVQIVRIMQDAIGRFHVYNSPFDGAIENNEGWQFIHDTVAREQLL